MNPETIYDWIQKRYDYYDKKEGRHCGEKYTIHVFNDAAEHFKITFKEVNELYRKAMVYSAKKKIVKEIIEDVIQNKGEESNAPSVKEPLLHNKKVKINIDKFKDKEDKLSMNFARFLMENADKTFTAKLDKSALDGTFYTFKENDTWLFAESDLIPQRRKR